MYGTYRVGIAMSSVIQPEELERTANNRVCGVPVFQVEEAGPAPEDVRFMLCFDAKPLAGMKCAQPRLETPDNLLVALAVKQAFRLVGGGWC